MDFSLKTYNIFLETLQTQGFQFLTIREFFVRNYPSSTVNRGKIFQNPEIKVRTLVPKIQNSKREIVLRHDVDALPEQSLTFAKIQCRVGIKGTFYFRVVPESWDVQIIGEIASMGHEIGYHYENMDSANAKCKMQNSKCTKEEIVNRAYEEFCLNLEKFRKIVPINTICMHGSPRSEFDNKEIWKKYDYKALGILGEPYFDIDFDKVFYLTDTGRRWDGWRVSMRDKVPQQEEWVRKGWVFHSTQDIINAIKEDRLPYPLMMTFHPQRWTDQPIPRLKEWMMQGVKNEVKRAMIMYEGRKAKDEGRGTKDE